MRYNRYCPLGAAPLIPSPADLPGRKDLAREMEIGVLDSRRERAEARLV